MKDQIKQSEGVEWELIKIPHGNSVYVPNQAQRASLLTQPRPHSYRKAIDHWNRVRRKDSQWKQESVQTKPRPTDPPTSQQK
jgi:hypothetical protein